MSEARGGGIMELDKARCRRLIALYAAQRALWHPAELGDRRQRARCWARVAARMQAPVPDIKRKMESLLGSYRREKSRERRTLLAESGKYKSRWHAYELFQFLADRPRPCLDCTKDHDTGTASNKEASRPASPAQAEPAEPAQPAEASAPLELQSVQLFKLEEHSDLESEVEVTLQLEPEPKPATRPYRKRKLVRARKPAARLSSQAEAERDPLAASGELASHDSCLAFGLFVASELRQFDARALLRVKRAICDLIFSTDAAQHAGAGAHLQRN